MGNKLTRCSKFVSVNEEQGHFKTVNTRLRVNKDQYQYVQKLDLSMTIHIKLSNFVHLIKSLKYTQYCSKLKHF